MAQYFRGILVIYWKTWIHLMRQCLKKTSVRVQQQQTVNPEHKRYIIIALVLVLSLVKLTWLKKRKSPAELDSIVLLDQLQYPQSGTPTALASPQH